MSNSIPLPHVNDREQAEQLHDRVVGQVNDMLITFQDASYALGIARGQRESGDAWNALAELVGALDRTNWSSWQTTATFDDALKHASELLKARKT